jgi:hypothetical protein
MRRQWFVTAAMAACIGWLPATAGSETATIETTRPIQGAVSEESLKEALRSALQRAAAGAQAMGLPFIMVDAAFVLPGAVTVRVVATDTPPAPNDEDNPAEREPRTEPPVTESPKRNISAPTM